MALLEGVIDPELGGNIVELGMAKGASVSDGVASIKIALTTLGCPLRAQIRKDVKARIESLPDIDRAEIDWTELTAEEKAATMATARRRAADDAPDTEIPATSRVIAVASGKGGVGKSSVTVNLAAGLAARGFTVGVMDADIWGFSIPRMLGVEGRLRGASDDEAGAGAVGGEDDVGSGESGSGGGDVGTKGGKKIAPNEIPVGDGLLKVVSMGLLVDDETDALMWRGLMLNRAVQHFLEDVRWGDMDYLVIDMPPGTGDVQMGLARMLPRAELLVVTTPATSAQKVAIRAVTMARKSHLRVAGVIENMSAFTCEHGSTYELFGSGGGEELAAAAGVPLLGRIPLEPSVARGGDEGNPVVLETGAAADAFAQLVDRVVEEAIPPVDLAGCSARMLDMAEAALDELDAQDAADSSEPAAVAKP